MIRAAHTRVELGCVDVAAQPESGHPRRGGGVRPAEDNERLPATFVYAGIDVEVQVLFAGVRGRQIAGRFTVVPAAPFAYGTGAQRGQWRALIAILQSLLRLHSHRTGSLVCLDEYLYRRSGGMIGSLSQLVRGAAILAIEDGSEQISKQLLDSVPVDYAAQRADTASRPPRRGSRAMRKASTAVSSSLAITEHLGLRQAGDPQLAEFLLRQAEAARSQRITSVA